MGTAGLCGTDSTLDVLQLSHVGNCFLNLCPQVTINVFCLAKYTTNPVRIKMAVGPVWSGDAPPQGTFLLHPGFELIIEKRFVIFPEFTVVLQRLYYHPNTNNITIYPYTSELSGGK